MGLRKRRYLRQMSYAQHLTLPGGLRKLYADLRRSPAAYTRVYLVENHRRYIVALRHYALYCEHYTGKLAAARRLVERLRLLAGVRGNEYLHLVHAVYRDLIRPHIECQRYVRHVQEPQHLAYLR